MSKIKDITNYVFKTTQGLVLLNIGIISLIVAFYGTLSGPMKEWGIGAFMERFFHMDLQPQDREGRIIMLYHSIAITFVALLVYLITDVVKFKAQQIKNIRIVTTVGYLLVVFFGLGFAYWGHNWAFHGLFIAGMTLMFYAGILLTFALWPWNKEYYVTDKDYAHTRNGLNLERLAFFIMAVATLGSVVFGAVAGAYWSHGFETFLAEDGVRHVHHTPLELAVIGHLHIMLTLIGVATTLIIGRWFDWKGILHKIGIPLFIIGIIVLTGGVWLVVPYQIYAHIIIYVGAVFAMSGALMLVIYGWGKMIRKGVSVEAKPTLLKRLKALLSDPLRFGSLWQMVFMNFTVSGVGIFMAVNLEEIFRAIPFREERITLTGHWHILAALIGTIILFYILSEVFRIKGKLRNWIGWGIIIGSDLAFAMATLFSLKRLWVSEENQEPIAKFYMLLLEIGLGTAEVILGIIMIYLLVRLLQRKIAGFTGLLALVLLVVSCGDPVPDVNPSSVKTDLTVDPSQWVQVPAGKFLYGLNEHEIEIDYDFEIMVTEVTYKQFASYLNAAKQAGKITIKNGFVWGFYPGDIFHGGRHEFLIEAGDYQHYNLNGQKTRLNYFDGVFSVDSGYELFPVAYVTWMGAKAYADFHEYRLPNSQEWEKAARGSDGQPYPFEGKPSPQKANYHHSKDPFDASNGTTPVGFYNGRVHGEFQTVDSPSPYGCYDLGGNVAEWLGELHQGSHLRLFYGGSMMDYAYNLRSFTENSGLPQYASFQVGFRCVRSVDSKN
ncbi:MAG: SUMF1/EgtB/PvdO family nonheme iron enzyme [Candidatus Marinimicrobia bacterium]|nr:SUMF1/EgtB/PvdO family nonheme iron enzyme [Candidatus Neomarinimicrobiota bacterium]